MSTRQWIGAGLIGMGVAIWVVAGLAITIVHGVSSLSSYWPVWMLAAVVECVGVTLGREPRR